jgi:hypothetical protein
MTSTAAAPCLGSAAMLAYCCSTHQRSYAHAVLVQCIAIHMPTVLPPHSTKWLPMLSTAACTQKPSTHALQHIVAAALCLHAAVKVIFMCPQLLLQLPICCRCQALPQTASCDGTQQCSQLLSTASYLQAAAHQSSCQHA